MAVEKDPEDKQVLIDNSDTAELAGNEESSSPPYAEIPLTTPTIGNKTSQRLTNGFEEEGNDSPELFKTYEEFAFEYEGFQSRVTFQTCTGPNNDSPPPQQSCSPLGGGGGGGSRGVCSYVTRRVRRLIRPVQKLGQWWRFHRKLLISCFLTLLGSAGCLIFFPLHLENVSRGIAGVGDGYSACLAASTVVTLLFLFNSVVLEVMERRKLFSESVLRPVVGWRSALKVGFCLGLSFVTIFYSWEDDKVPCNFQDPLLGLVIIFAIITHAVCRWKSIGLKRAFALSAVAAGVFLSVDYPLVDHHRCRGHYYQRTDQETSITWTWQVHFVWTMAFVVSIWLATIAAFFLESSIPVPKVKHSRLYDLEYNAVKLRVMSKNGGGTSSADAATDVAWPGENCLNSFYRFSPYAQFNLGLISNAVLWFSVTTWAIILSLFWTEFIPGFGKGIRMEKLPDRILAAFQTSLTNESSWALFVSVFTFSHAFTYVTVLTRSPITAISVSTVGFPIIGLWWSFFQINHSFFVWMPVMSGELICATLGLVSVCTGVYYFVKFEILKPARVHKTRVDQHY